MFKKIISSKNVGRFRNSALSDDPQLAKHTYIVGAKTVSGRRQFALCCGPLRRGTPGTFSVGNRSASRLRAKRSAIYVCDGKVE